VVLITLAMDDYDEVDIETKKAMDEFNRRANKIALKARRIDIDG